MHNTANETYFNQRIPIFLNLGFNKDHLPQLKSYIEQLWKSNEKLNLISRKMTFEELIDNHLIDCLLPLKSFPKDIKIVVEGCSGGGIHGVLYAIQFPHIQFQLFEKSPMKQDFLNLCKSFTKSITVQGEIPLELKNIDLVISRGFKPLDVTLNISRRYYQNKGRYFLLKARHEKINEEIQESLKKFKDLKVEIVNLKSPVLEVERHLLLINFSNAN
jgi:16S rRNA (guanine527-N7)-methyltransferase